MKETEGARAQRIRRLGWASRRGLLELDLFLVPFVEDRLGSLEEAALADYERLMFEEDTTLLDWLHDRARPDDPPLASLVASIRAHRLQLSRERRGGTGDG